MDVANVATLRIAVIGGGPAGSLFALYALKYARLAGRSISVTIYEEKDFHQFGRAGCNMCAGIIPTAILYRLAELDLTIPSELILSHIRTYSLHTSAGSINATQPDAQAEIVTVYRGAGPRYGHLAGLIGFDEFLLEKALSRGAELRRSFVQVVRRGQPIEIVANGESERFDLVVLAIGVNGHPPMIQGFDYLPPPVGSMCQTEIYLGQEEVQQRLGPSVHIFLPSDEIATYGILIPKGPFVTVSLLNARRQMGSLHQFLQSEAVTAVLGTKARRVCGCLPKIPVGLAGHFINDGFVAIGDASASRLYKNGIGSALATAERAAWTAIHRGYTKHDFATNYLPICRAIDSDNIFGRMMFLEVPILKHFGLMPMAHYHVATNTMQHQAISELHARILWGMFTGAYSYWELFRMAATPRLIAQLALAVGRAMLQPHR